MTAKTNDPVELSRTLGERLDFVRQSGDEKAFTDAILAQLSKDRLLWVVAPSDKGGASLSIGDTARVTFNIARLSGSAGLIYAMHVSQALTVVRHGGDSAFFSNFLQSMVRSQALVASGTSENGVNGDIFGSVCTIENGLDGRLALTKESPIISYMDHAKAILVSAMRAGPNDRKSQVLIAIETKDIEFQPGRAMGFLGMRGILNRPYTFMARFSEDAIFSENYPAIARATMTPSVHIFWAALWSGIASSALDKAKSFVARESPSADNYVAGMMHGELSRLVDKHYAINALISDAITEFDERSAGAMGMAHTARVKRLKVVCSELLTEICFGVLGLLGMRGYAEEGPYSLAETLRDALSARVMISNYRLLMANAKIERFLEEGI